MDIKKVTSIIQFDKKIKKVKAELDTLKKERQILEKEVMEEFDEGLNSVKTDDGTAYLRRDVYCSLVDRDVEASKEYIRGLGLGDYIDEKVSTPSLSAWYREREIDDEVPADFGEHVKVSETFAVRTTA